MFKLSRKGEYAIRLILHLAANPGKVCTTGEIAKVQDIPSAFLKKIIQDLRPSGFIASAKGQKGGILLNTPPENISVSDIIQAVEGPLFLNVCLVKKGACSRDEVCPVHEMWRKCQEAVDGIWKANNFKEMAERGKQLAWTQAGRMKNGGAGDGTRGHIKKLKVRNADKG
ncbi:MAG: Rrf2 family transcriptional regulator [Nitrospinae bacterium]|nr:Rrf2 family transcriptional regulator [Nitrospinota bacterium]